MTSNVGQEKLTVLHVSTLNQPIRPDLGYGPIESVIYNIDKGLHSLNQRSIVACSGDSIVAGEHYVTVEQSIGDYFMDNSQKHRGTMQMHLSRALERAKMGDIDIIHMHDAKSIDFIYDSLLSMYVPIVMTLHVPAKESFLEGTYQRWCNPALSSPLVTCVAISEFQRRQYDDLVNADVVVHHGIDVEEYPVKKEPEKGSYLFIIGRLTRYKGQDKAIEVAKKTGSKLIIAGCVQDKPEDVEFFAGLRNSIDLLVEVDKHPVDNDYYNRTIKPLLNCDKQVIYIGEISSENKKQWYLHARATLFPIQWDEPFGLVLIESMACGTPVISFDKGAVREIVVDGKTGFVTDAMNAMIESVGLIDGIDPRECRRHVQSHFSTVSMAQKYLKLYNRIIDSHKLPESCSSFPGDYLSKRSTATTIGIQ